VMVSLAISIFFSGIETLAYSMGNIKFSKHLVATKIEGALSFINAALWVYILVIVLNPSNGLAMMYVGKFGTSVAYYQAAMINATIYFSSWASFICSVTVLIMYLWDRFGKTGGLGMW
jgi:hypothetical protein